MIPKRGRLAKEIAEKGLSTNESVQRFSWWIWTAPERRAAMMIWLVALHEKGLGDILATYFGIAPCMKKVSGDNSDLV